MKTVKEVLETIDLNVSDNKPQLDVIKYHALNNHESIKRLGDIFIEYDQGIDVSVGDLLLAELSYLNAHNRQILKQLLNNEDLMKLYYGGKK
jgi:hypothetical protein